MSELDIRGLAIIGLLTGSADLVREELSREFELRGYSEIREGHGCVFGNIAPEGSRLTELSERSGLTKQAVGEAVTDLERLGYVERLPDPTDGRAKIIRLTDRGAEAQAAGFAVMADLEGRWAELYGADRVAVMREVLADIVSGAPAPAHA